MIDRDLIGRPYGKEFLKKEVNNVTSFCTILFEGIDCFDPDYFGDEKVDKYYIMKNIRNYTYNKRIPVITKIGDEFLSTLKLVIATYDLYKDKIPNCTSLLTWTMSLLEKDITILSNCPKFTSIDKNLNCIKEFYGYIDEVRTAYYYGTNPSRNITPPVYTGKSRKLVKNDKVLQIQNMFTEIVREDTYEYISSKGIEFNLERMFSNYEFYRDIIEYKLQDVDDFSWNLDSELVKFYDISDNDDCVMVECIDCRTLPLEMALHVSYMMGCKVTISYLNRNNKVTIFEIIDGVPRVIKNKSKKAKFISRLLLNINKSKFNREALSKFILDEFDSKEKFDIFGRDIEKILQSKFDVNMNPDKKKKLYKKKLFTKVNN